MVRVLACGARGLGFNPCSFLLGYKLVGKKLRTCHSRIVRCHHAQVEVMINLILAVLSGMIAGLDERRDLQN